MVTLKDQIRRWIDAHIRVEWTLDDIREDFQSRWREWGISEDEINNREGMNKSIRNYVAECADPNKPMYMEGLQRRKQGVYFYDPPLSPLEEAYYIVHRDEWGRPYKRVNVKRTVSGGRRSGLSGELKLSLFEAQGRVCTVCGVAAERLYMLSHVDHRIPVADGGGDSLDNYQLIHASCNMYKATRSQEDVWEWAENCQLPDGLPLLLDRNMAAAKKAYEGALRWSETLDKHR